VDSGDVSELCSVPNETFIPRIRRRLQKLLRSACFIGVLYSESDRSVQSVERVTQRG
jgi:hypothetical protein